MASEITSLKQPTVQNRWLVVVAAVVLNLALGALYSWPVFSNFLEKALPAAERWDSFQTQLVFSMATVFLAVGVITAGQLSERHQPRTLIIFSAIFTGGGYVLGGVLPLLPPFLVATIGVMVGFGIGLAYALPISLAAKWFPDRKGLVTGLAMAGFGIGSVLWSQLFDLALAVPLGIRWSFVLYGVLFAAMILATVRFLHDPPEGYAERLASRSPQELAPRRPRLAALVATHQPARDARAPDYTRVQILSQYQLYFLVYTFMVGSAIGLMVIGMSKTYPIERLVASGYSPQMATNITRLGALILFPIFNGNGRIILGWLSDRFGWRRVIVGSYAIQAVILISFPWLMSAPATVVIALPLLAMCYGGNFTVFPVATGQIWGYKHLAANYSLVFVAFGVGALIGPPVSGAAKDAGIITTAFLVSGILLAIGSVLIGFLKPPAEKK